MTNEADNAIQTDGPSTMADGTVTKTLFVKNFSLGDWELLSRIKDLNGHESYADALRWAVRKAAGVLG